MIHFEDEYFRKLNFTDKQIDQYFQAALGDLKIAKENSNPEIVFRFSYDALIKLGIFLIARLGYKVRSANGHHAKILEKMDKILKNEDIAGIGNKMRQKRNANFYDGGLLITEKDSDEYLRFVDGVFQSVKDKQTLFDK